MTEIPFLKQAGRGLLPRVLLMLVMALAFYLSATLLLILSLAQTILTVCGDEPNPRLARFGRMLGQYLRQIAEYETFASERAPFPFSDWPEER